MKLAALAFAGVTFISLSVFADDKVSAKVNGPVYQAKEQIVIGRPAKPLVATEVSTLPMKMTLTDLKLPLAARVEQPVASSPF